MTRNLLCPNLFIIIISSCVGLRSLCQLIFGCYLGFSNPQPKGWKKGVDFFTETISFFIIQIHETSIFKFKHVPLITPLNYFLMILLNCEFLHCKFCIFLLEKFPTICIECVSKMYRKISKPWRTYVRNGYSRD